jgi:fatty acid CoA ligase FadD9
LKHFRDLAADCLEVVPGDLGLPNLGLDEATWARLAGSVDLIAHTAAHVNHMLPYTQLFNANVVGTAELVRLALTGRLKHFDYVSTLGMIALASGSVEEDRDIRQLAPACEIDDGYANGYNISKWAGEVLLREAHDLCGLPVSVFRPAMILAHSRYAGQLNLPDMFTRLLYSLAVTGVAPATFYAEDLSAGRPVSRYEGIAVDFLAEAITAIGVTNKAGFHSYNLANPHDDGVSLDSFVDWMIEAGCKIERVDSYSEWLSRFESAMNGLPDEQRHQSMLPILGPYRRPQGAVARSFVPVERFRAAALAAGRPIPGLSAALIYKYVDDLRRLSWL